MLSFKILKLDIFQSYFFGEIEFRTDKYKINIQNQRRGKVLKLPFEQQTKNGKVVVRLTGPGDLFVEDYLEYKGESEWLEIDSDEITYFLADHQDQCDTIEIMID
ncbi:MAG: hypothetical protein OEW86_08415 [Nitrosopumilus sp.]|nr:hypothetical protein [Nitrosopumilus sp.]MDH3516782.1 hypothetical protein [Nitrosopumilus sp.]MDH3565586.1 hypothetical protein [Nitrosopumilus sp.]MDH5417990.1 hypothetical protein [Nitrosopumilus sp.]MDH5555051.1 hypothetical protein [Nitrosopumilus sp.]